MHVFMLYLYFISSSFLSATFCLKVLMRSNNFNVKLLILYIYYALINNKLCNFIRLIFLDFDVKLCIY